MTFTLHADTVEITCTADEKDEATLEIWEGDTLLAKE